MSGNTDVWAIVELMGHMTLAGRLTKPGENGGLWQIDVPDGDHFASQLFGSQSVYRVRIVSEEMARAYAGPQHALIEYDAPIVTRQEHEAAMDRAREALQERDATIHELRDRLTRINKRALKAGEETLPA
ncbi:MAG TPA: hypothetical protein P5144_10320 [Thermoanaerobaculia bacterium]|nr:hypothetical protein [Thermoanaerobaculia bacterium]